jgi:hypothetical protein
MSKISGAPPAIAIATAMATRTMIFMIGMYLGRATSNLRMLRPVSFFYSEKYSVVHIIKDDLLPNSYQNRVMLSKKGQKEDFLKKICGIFKKI